MEIAIEKLKPSEYNPRKISEKELKKLTRSIKEFGFVEPIVVNKDFTVIGGHQRLKAAQFLEMTSIPVVQIDIPKGKEKALNLALNRISGEWDENLLAKLLQELSAEEKDLTGFNESEINQLLDSLIGNDEKDDLVPALPKKAKSKLGDIYQLGNHRVMCGDSTRKEDVEKLMNGEKAELLFTSPPYSDMREYGGGNIDVEHLSNFIFCFNDYARYMIINIGIQRKNNEVNQYWDAYIKKAKESGYKFLSWNIWKQDSAGSIGKQKAFFPIEHEWLLVFGKDFKDINRTEKRKHNKRKTSSTHREFDGSLTKHSVGKQEYFKELGTVLECPSEKTAMRKNHPAIYPVFLPEKFILVMSENKDNIIDPFLGSGTTIIAAEKTGRVCYGMEIEPLYIDVIIQRWEGYTGKKALAIS